MIYFVLEDAPPLMHRHDQLLGTVELAVVEYVRVA